MTYRLDLKFCREVAEDLARSGSYDGADARALLPRILAGAALDLDPVTAAGGVAVARGKPTLNAAIQAALLDRSERYDYRLVRCTDEVAEVEILRDGSPLGSATFSIAEAQRAGLLKKIVWQQYPSDLLFARALTRAIRRFAPKLLVGNAAYTREELGEDVREPRPASQFAGQPVAPLPVPKPGPTHGQLADLKRLKDELGVDASTWKMILDRRGVATARDLSPAQAEELLGKLRHRVATQQLEEGLREAAKVSSLTIDVPLARKQEVEPGSGSAGFPG